MTENLRLDKWLWQARFFKTRALASRAISGGGLRLDGQVMAKPHRSAHPGQVLTFSQGARVRVIEIKAVGSRRGPAAEAALLYHDLAPPPPPGEKPQTPPAFEDRSRGTGRPTKRDRRVTERLKDMNQ